MIALRRYPVPGGLLLVSPTGARALRLSTTPANGSFAAAARALQRRSATPLQDLALPIAIALVAALLAAGLFMLHHTATPAQAVSIAAVALVPVLTLVLILIAAQPAPSHNDADVVLPCGSEWSTVAALATRSADLPSSQVAKLARVLHSYTTTPSRLAPPSALSTQQLPPALDPPLLELTLALWEPDSSGPLTSLDRSLSLARALRD
jgi:hypothetical protein